MSRSAIPSDPQLTPIPMDDDSSGFPASLRILRKIAVGGMSKIYMAVQEPLGRRVALKILTVTTHESLTRFTREAVLLSSLDHEGLIHVHDFLSDRSSHYIIMEYVEGSDLSHLIQAGPISAEVTAWIGYYLSRVLSYIHVRGIIHRDIKPSNVIISREGRLKLVDFGIAKHIHDPSLSPEDSGIGTPCYMSPERIDGGMADSRSDIYSVGVLLYRLLAGRLPFEDTLEHPLFDQIQHKRPDPVPGVPAALFRIVLRCLEKNPDDRYLNADQLRADLERFLDPSGNQEEGELELLKWLEERQAVPEGTTLQKITLLQSAGYMTTSSEPRFSRRLRRTAIIGGVLLVQALILAGFFLIK